MNSLKPLWLRKQGRKLAHMDRDENSNRFSVSQNDWSESDHARRPSVAFDCVVASTLVSAGIKEGSSASHTSVCSISAKRTRKHKSRWDQVSWEYPVVTNPASSSLQRKELNVESSSLPQTSTSTEDKDVSGCTNDQLDKVDLAHDVKQNTADDDDDDVPPGFSSPLMSTMGMGLSLGPSIVFGHPQEKFLSGLPVSYGVPLSIIQQFGAPETVGSWVVAPGMPFLPFPPLPSLPRRKKDSSPSENRHCLTINQPAEDLSSSYLSLSGGPNHFLAHDVKQNTATDDDDDVPPGFSFPLMPTMGMGLSLGPSVVCHFHCPPDTAVGHPQEEFLSHLPVSYGVPLSIILQFGPPETVRSWVVAPGMPFLPFPPLPPTSLW
uniref:Uncharacterized protein n=1 Tax=Cannabis sativa TaxID=3483 RepID=A0A803QWS1_CANSA